MKAASVSVSRFTEVTCQLRSAAVSKILCRTDRPGRQTDRQTDRRTGKACSTTEMEKRRQIDGQETDG